jgi:hypothetical protein
MIKKNNFLFFLNALFSFSAFSFVPDLGLVVRRQAQNLKSNPVPFSYEGTIEVEGEKAKYTSTWYGVSSGSVVRFQKIPTTWSTLSVNEIILHRSPSQCLLFINKVSYSCLKYRFWNDFESGGSIERINQTLTSLGVPSGDLSLKTINSTEYLTEPSADTSIKNIKINKMKPFLRSLQGTFMAVLDYSVGGAAFSFDTNTYAPLYAKIPMESGVIWELIGNPSFRLEKEESRNNLIINSRVEVKSGASLLGLDKREEFKRLSKVEMPSLAMSHGSVADPALDKFTEKGKTFLKILFLTH